MTSDNIKVSVIVPIYNTEKYLEKCILSMLDQTLKEIEIILINDGSTDNSAIICENYAKKYPNKINYINNKNCGCSASRNLGISLAKGEYISFIDSDDYIEKEMYEKMYEKAKSEDLDIIVCGIVLHNFDGTIRYSIPETPIDEYDYLLPKMKVSNIWNKIYKTDFLKRIEVTFLETIHCFEDLLFSFECYTQAKKVFYLKEPFYHYILHGENSVFNLEKRKGIFIAFNTLYEYLKENSFLSDKKIKRNFYKNFHFYAIEGVYILLLNPLVSDKEYKKYSSIFTYELKKLNFLTLKSKFLILYYRFLAFFIRKTNIYSILKKIKHSIKYRRKV